MDGEGVRGQGGKTLGEGIDPLQRGFLQQNPHHLGNFQDKILPIFGQQHYSEEVLTICGRGVPINTCGKGGGELLPVCCLERFPSHPLDVIPALYYLPYNCVYATKRWGGWRSKA